MGTPEDPAGTWTIHGLAARKNDIFLEMISAEGVRAFPGTTALVRRLRAVGTPLGLVTASRNAAALPSTAGLAGAFDVVVDGTAAARPSSRCLSLLSRGLRTMCCGLEAPRPEAPGGRNTSQELPTWTGPRDRSGFDDHRAGAVTREA